MSYLRVIPRDLFNEAKLLKCLGQLALILHDYPHRYPIAIEHDGEAFTIEQDPSNGALYCPEIAVVAQWSTISVWSPYNSKDTYPLMFSALHDDYKVFNDDGTFTQEFISYMGDFDDEYR